MALLAASAVAILGTLFLGWRFGMAHVDLPTRVNTVVAVCAFILVGASVVVAVLAYIAATGRPDLHAELQFRFSDLNQPVLGADPASESPVLGRRSIAKWRQTECQVVLVNRSRFAARNAGMRIELDGLGGLQEQPGWADVAWSNMIGRTAIQWDGGADYLIHGRWARILPQLTFDEVFEYRRDPPPALTVIIAADGFGPTRLDIPVRILEPDEYSEYSAQRAAAYLAAQEETPAQREAEDAS